MRMRIPPQHPLAYTILQEVGCKKRNAEWNGIWNGTWNRIWNALSLPRMCQLCDHTHLQEVNYKVMHLVWLIVANVRGRGIVVLLKSCHAHSELINHPLRF